MNWTAIGAVGEVLGAIAVVLSLVYVAAQVRHNTTALSRASSADAIAGIRHWNQNLIEDPVMVGIFGQGVEDMNGLDEAGRARFAVLPAHPPYPRGGPARAHRQARAGSAEPGSRVGTELNQT